MLIVNKLGISKESAQIIADSLLVIHNEIFLKCPINNYKRIVMYRDRHKQVVLSYTFD
jgi:hypothetical protein